jgi:hypothetical protein
MIDMYIKNIQRIMFYIHTGSDQTNCLILGGAGSDQAKLLKS